MSAATPFHTPAFPPAFQHHPAWRRAELDELRATSRADRINAVAGYSPAVRNHAAARVAKLAELEADEA